MKPQTIKSILGIGTLVGIVTLGFANIIHGRPEPSSRVARMYAIEQLMNQPDFSVRELSNFEYSDLDKVKNKYNILSREKENLILAGADEEKQRYENGLTVQVKRYRIQLAMGTGIVAASGL